MRLNRRDVLHVGLATTLMGLPSGVVADDALSQTATKPATDLLSRLCFFTDVVDDSGFSYKDVAKLIEQLKIAGPDLTVREGGLVPPDRVVEELPKAVAVFREHGLTVPMLTTNITSADTPVAKSIIKLMGELGIRYYKLGYFHYGELEQWQSDLHATQKKVIELVKLGAQAGVQAGIHNHAGRTIGGPMWDLVELLEPLDPKWVGSYFDPAHATIEGGAYGWQLGLQRLAPRIKMLALKDFIFEKRDGGWRPRWCPLGEGMVRWDEFISLLQRVQFDGPVSLHIEYDPGGNTPAERLEKAFAAADKDLAFLKGKLTAAATE